MNDGIESKKVHTRMLEVRTWKSNWLCFRAFKSSKILRYWNYEQTRNKVFGLSDRVCV